MTFRPGRVAALATMLVAAGLSSACTQIRSRQGYLMDDVLTASVQPGVDNRESVQGTLGRPSFVGQFDQKDWYYVSRDTRQLAFKMPRPVAQTVLHIRFDDAGNVTSVEKTGLEKVASIEPSDDKTPTLGRDRGFFQELFGNIGQVGAAGPAGQTADNPQ
jgi:outer membrane protein assembly factor BamE (lipoprotein component of BamABCDE complex)